MTYYPKLTIMALVGGVFVTSLLLIVDSVAPNEMGIAEVVRYLWVPGFACSALVYRAGIHDGSAFIYLAVVFTTIIYSVLTLLVALGVMKLRRRRV